VYAAVTDRPVNVRLVKHLAETMLAVTGGDRLKAVAYLQTVLRILNETSSD
jgi:hypothetical protein